MNKDQREIQRKLRILQYADEIGSVVKACRYFGVGRSSFYRWRQAYVERGESMRQGFNMNLLRRSKPVSMWKPEKIRVSDQNDCPSERTARLAF